MHLLESVGSLHELRVPAWKDRDVVGVYLFGKAQTTPWAGKINASGVTNPSRSMMA